MKINIANLKSALLFLPSRQFVLFLLKMAFSCNQMQCQAVRMEIMETLGFCKTIPWRKPVQTHSTLTLWQVAFGEILSHQLPKKNTLLHHELNSILISTSISSKITGWPKYSLHFSLIAFNKLSKVESSKPRGFLKRTIGSQSGYSGGSSTSRVTQTYCLLVSWAVDGNIVVLKSFGNSLIRTKSVSDATLKDSSTYFSSYSTDMSSIKIASTASNSSFALELGRVIK